MQEQRAGKMKHGLLGALILGIFVACGCSDKGRSPLVILSPDEGPQITTYDPVETSQAMDEHTLLSFHCEATDPDGDALTYAWTRDASPVGAGGEDWTLVAAEPDGGTTTLVRCTAASSGGEDYIQWTVIINEVNDPPVADPAQYTTVKNLPYPLTLTGSDPEGGVLSFEIVATPLHGSLSGMLPNITYTPDLDYVGDDSFTFKAFDGSSYSSEATISMHVRDNSAPAADAGPDLLCAAGRVARLDGRASSDPDSDLLTFAWSQVGGTTVLLSDPAGARTCFTPAQTGTYQFQLVVSDGFVNSPPGAVQVTVENAPAVEITNADAFESPVSGMQTLQGTAADIDGDLSAVRVSIDGGPWQDAAGRATWSYGFAVNVTGDSFTGQIFARMPYIRVKAADAAGFESEVAEVGGDYANDVVSYMPAWGQHVNNTAYNAATRLLGYPIGGGGSLPDNSKLLSLGAFGGSAIVHFHKGIANNSPDRPAATNNTDELIRDSIDFTVFGNAFYSGGNPRSRWSEPCYIMVMKDENANSLADDTWYLIPGSHIHDLAAQFETCTYHRTDPAYDPLNKLHYPGAAYYPAYPDSVIVSGYHTAALEGMPAVPGGSCREVVWGYGDHSPVNKLGDHNGDNNAADPGEAGTLPGKFYDIPDHPFRLWMSAGSGGGDPIDISWAIDTTTGLPANLDIIHFVKVVNGLGGSAGPLGELSGELGAIVTAMPDGCWPQAGRDAENRAGTARNAPANPVILWKTDSIGALDGTAPVIWRDRVFVRCTDSLKAFDLNTGAPLWSQPIAASAAGDATSPAVHANLVFAASGNQAYCFHLDGAGEWQQTLSGTMAGGGIMAQGGRLYVSTRDGKVISISPHDGSENWSVPAVPGALDAKPAWSPSEHIYVAVRDTGAGKVARLAAADGAADPVCSDPDSLGVRHLLFTTLEVNSLGETDVVLAAARDDTGGGKLRCLRADSLAQLWEAPLPEGAGPSAALGQKIYICCGPAGQGQTICLTGGDGSRLWATPAGEGLGKADTAPAVFGNGILVAAESNRTALLSPADGSSIWQANYSSTMYAASGGKIVGITGGRLFCISD